MVSTKLNLVFLVAFALVIPTLLADIGVFDEVWQQRAEEARQAALEAYTPNPEEVTENFNAQVTEYVLYYW